MTWPQPSPQPLQDQVKHCYDALRWGGVEAEVRVAQLAVTLRLLEQHTGRQRRANGAPVQRRPRQPRRTPARRGLLSCARPALRPAQERGVVPTLPADHATGQD